ncbi:DUF935 domain-containing protein [Zavarzinia compransoris]|nr:DUF935 family protein [Zavarzinia compransoris]TDP46062.1 phage gp29-like protein [Zavarzinia compransoris]
MVSEVKQADLRREIATIARDVTAPLAGFVLRPRDETLIQQGGGLGLKLYEDLHRDPHTMAVLRKRRMAVIAREWELEAASEAPVDAAAKDLCEAVLKRLAFDRLCLGLLHGLLLGYSVAEVVWGEAVIGVTRIIPIAAFKRGSRRFVFGADGALRLLTVEEPVDGEALPPFKFIVAVFGGDEVEDPYGLGLGATLFWPVYFKRQGIAFWLTFVERFAAPTVIGEYPPNASEAEQDKMLAALGALSQETGIIMPQGMAIRLLEAMRSGSIDSYEKLCRYMDEQISEAVLGETLSTSVVGTGSRAASQTHNEVREELTDADADLLSDVLNTTLLPWIVRVNMPGASAPRLWRKKPDGQDLKVLAERDSIIRSWGFEPDEDYVRGTYGGAWKKVPPGADLRAGAGAGAGAGAPVRASAPAREGPAFAERSDAIDEAVSKLLAEDGWEPLVAGLVDGLEKQLASAKTEEDATAILSEVFGRMGISALAEALARASFAARLAGEVDDPLSGG